jgi:dolichol kinase
MALSMFILGDAVAAIVGLGMGRISVAGKTLEGSAACFLLCLTLLVGAYPLVPGLLDAWGGRLAFPVVLAAALSTTVLELFPVRLGPRLVINDNLTVPLVTGALMLVLYPGCAGP